MANQKPLITIDKFSGMGQNGILYCEGFYPEVDNQKSVMGDGYYTNTLFNGSTTGFSDLAQNAIVGMISLSTINSASSFYNLFIDSGVYQRIYAYQEIGTDIKDGTIHTSPTTNYCRYPDIIETNNGNILFPSERYIGKGFRGKATGGSTTTLIDTTKNFGTLGFAANDKVTNLKTGIEYTITSITTTTNTNDTLNFTASGSNSNTANDEYIAWIDDNYNTNLTRAVWQPNQADWVKQFKLYGNRYLFTNGNYLGIISADESTVDATYKQLPARHQALCFDTNNEQILVSANYNGKGIFLLWDGYTDGWNNIIELDSAVNALANYKSGWIFVTNGIVYYTDGYQIQKMYDVNTSKKLSTNSVQPAYHNGLTIYRDILYIANGSIDNNLIEPGVYILDLSNPNNGFSNIKCIRSGRADGIPYSVSTVNRFSNYQSVYAGGYGFVDSLGSEAAGAYRDNAMIVSLSLPEPMRITGIGLNLTRILKDYNNDITTAKSRVVQVSVGDGNRGLLSYIQAKADGNTTTFTVNGETWLNHEVGDELYQRQYKSTLFGERTFITSIADKGTATETWTVSPALSGNVSANDIFKAIRVKKLDRKTINDDDLAKEIMFYNPNTGILSNKLFIEIVVFGQTNAMPININEIKVYGD